MDFTLQTSILNYLNFPALIIDNEGTVVCCSKNIKKNYKINAGDNFFTFCQNPKSISEFILNLSNLPIGSDNKCLIQFSFIKNNVEVYLSVINKTPTLFLIEFKAELAISIDNDLIDNTDNLLSLVDRNYTYLAVNEQYSNKWGVEKKDIVHKHVTAILGEDVFKKVVKKELDACFNGKMRTYTDWFYSEQKQQMMFMKVSYHPVINQDTKEVKSVAVTVTDITDIQLHYDELSEKAFHDPLTMLENRYSLFDYFDKLKATLSRSHTYCLVMIDLDKFKQVNDLHGHNTGDKLLQAFAKDLKATLRKDDFCCRWGGDEFILLLSGTQSAAGLKVNKENITARLQSLQNKNYLIDDITLSLTFSFGLSFFPNETNELQELIDIADKNMFREKSEH